MNSFMQGPVFLDFLVCLILASGELAAAERASPASSFDPPAIRRPSALVAEGADGQVFLEWNPNLEEGLAGYHVYRRGSSQTQFACVTPKILNRPAYTDTQLDNGTPYHYRVTALLGGGQESEPSNEVSAAPRVVRSAQITSSAAEWRVPSLEPIRIPHALTMVFENGHRLIFDQDQVRLRDWVSPEGTHLVYPKPYGNPVELTELNEFGLPQPNPATAERPAGGTPINLDYRQRQGQMAPIYVGHKVSANRVTLEYRIPLSGPGIPQGTTHDVWVWATVWETWRPVTRYLGGTAYHGLARQIELDVPSYYQDGFSLCLNDGFGVNGSCDQATTYELRWSNRSFLLETHWEKGKDQAGCGSPRGSSGFHPTECSTQVMPFLFAHFPQGTMLLAPRHYYYATTYAWRNYAAQGQDGLWPNYAIDLVSTGERMAVETFEYLWAPAGTNQAPQRFMDATFNYRRQLADLYGLKRDLPCLDYAWDYWGPGRDVLNMASETDRLRRLREWAQQTAERAKQAGADRVGGCHELWVSSPYTVDDEVRLNELHPINQAIRALNQAFAEKGLEYAYWVRPEFVKQALPNVLSSHFHTPYYGYAGQTYPPGLPLVEQRGLPLIRQNPGWIRAGRKGVFPLRTPYNWTPMSLTAPGWYEEVHYKSLVMMKRLGFASVFQDGGYCTLTGVDYTGGRARPVQPYYWRFYQDLSNLGLDLAGECPVGWAANTLPTPKPGDLDNLWAYTLGTFRGNRDGGVLRWFTPQMRHRAHQLYIGCYLHLDSAAGHAGVARFAQGFVKQHGPPDRVFLENLRRDETAGKWTWDRVWWEYSDGRRVLYPESAEVIK